MCHFIFIEFFLNEDGEMNMSLIEFQKLHHQKTAHALNLLILLFLKAMKNKNMMFDQNSR